VTTNTTNAVILRELHVPGRPLVLPNAWDAASARLVEAAGFPVVATSSYAMADVLGYDDGELRRSRRCSPPPRESSGR
jgi:2-methylisocitrate lyase-like PEP mutase family enzyme